MQTKNTFPPIENPGTPGRSSPPSAPRALAGSASRCAAVARFVALTLAGLTAACAQNTMPAEAPASAPVAAPEAAAPAAVPTPGVSAPTPGQLPAFTESNFGMAFKYIDTNQDGQISRQEGARFRGVARHFDAADLNHDGVLSRQEFDNAMKRSLPK